MQRRRASCRVSLNCQQRRTLPVTWRWTSSKRRGRCREIWFAVAMRGRKILTKSVSSLCKTPRKSAQPSPRTGAPSMTVPPYRRRVSGGCYRCRVGNWGGRKRRRETAADTRRFMFLSQTHTELHFFYTDLLCWQTCSTLWTSCGDVTRWAGEEPGSHGYISVEIG